MQMKPEEIRRSYEEAARKEAQIRILAELNLCQKEDIRHILVKQGIPEDELPRRRGRKKNPAEPDTASIPVKHGEQVMEKILKSIIEYIEKYGYPPTIRDIGEMTGIKSTSTVKHHLNQMIADGILETSHENSPRAIRIPGYRFVKEEAMDKLKLPCSIGSDVYIIPSRVNFNLNILDGHEKNNRVYHQKVAKIVYTESGWYMECNKDLEYGTGRVHAGKLYKETWFLSQTEAEEALKRLQKAAGRKEA